MQAMEGEETRHGGNEETLVWKNTKYMKATGDERNQKGGMNMKRMEAKAKKKKTIIKE